MSGLDSDGRTHPACPQQCRTDGGNPMTELTLMELQRIVQSCVGASGALTLDQDSLDAPFIDLDMDSLVVYEIITQLEDRLPVAISDDDIDSLKTPRQLLDLVNGRLLQAAG
jgi:minimal PKS acyl carrier protein